MGTCGSPQTDAPSTYTPAVSSTLPRDCRTPLRQLSPRGSSSPCSTRAARPETWWRAYSWSPAQTVTNLWLRPDPRVLLTNQGETMSVPEMIDSRTHRVLAGVSRVAVLEALRVNAGLLDVQAIAEQVGLHTNTVRSHLDQLMAAGLVESEVQERKTPGRPRLLFRATARRVAGPEDS